MSSLKQNVIRHKIGLLNLATELGNVSKACKVMGLSRDTFYRDQNAVAAGGIEALFDGNRRKPNPKNRGKKPRKPRFSPTPPSNRPTARSEPATNCAHGASLFPHPAFVPSGCVTTWLPSSSDYPPWRNRSPSKASC